MDSTQFTVKCFDYLIIRKMTHGCEAGITLSNFESATLVR